MSPTVFREGPYRFFFFSREEERMHIHVSASEGEAKFWMDPKIELAKSYRFNASALTAIERMIGAHEHDIRAAWNKHFGR